ncbi:TetR family transcriptional regulator [Castellaniella sp. GW247-6E4]|uniref:TetR family transcriptional regulator n=1 Tax=Castellaniella sp. GW247-6E4 TaxID=3140380 RepID=UPI0033159236
MASRKPAKGRPPASLARGAEQTRADILSAATHEFAGKGFAGAHVDNIAALTQTSKRMIYYHFGNKEGLYLAVLESAYGQARIEEARLRLDGLTPEAAMRTLVRFRFDYHNDHPDYIRLVMNENILNGRHLAGSKRIGSLSSPAIETIRGIYERGVEAGVFRRGLDLLNIHMSISSLSFHNVSNRHTFTILFGRDWGSLEELRARRAHVEDMILRYMTDSGR